MQRAISGALSVACAALACGDDQPHQIYLNGGAACLSAEAGVLRAEIGLLHCLSSSCNRLVASACTISERDGSVKLSSRFVMERDTGAEVCTADCGDFRTACETVEPEPGTYRVVYGPASVALDFPLAAATQLLPDSSLEPCEP
jgi:hypothetical protein